MDKNALYVTVLTRETLTEEEYLSLLAGSSDECRRRAQGLCARTDAENALLAEGLAKDMLLRHAGLDMGRRSFARNAYGKPYLPEHAGLHFNISHSGTFVACAVAARPVGIDIQTVRGIERDLRVARRFFAAQEYTYIISGDLAGRARRFSLIWAMKESYVKREGRGLRIPLDSFNVLALAGDQSPLFHEIAIGNEAVCQVCCELPAVTAIALQPAARILL
ncbi:MAG: 4'-phosphopantetheinyl transferase superfamily protein [Oscillospiraceae bacterium]|jgi:4'-phosphopantetheinyl transferase|nr:4'-phosphopantetheinyl transferase superfamily protein [Oscillospiraceae bacterium]